MKGPTRPFDPDVTADEAGGLASMEDTIAAPDSLSSSSGDRQSTPIPQSIGRHQVVELLGSGGMGVVFAARDPELERPLAIKLVHRGAEAGAQNTAARARMKREAQAMAKLTHPNVITVYDVGEHEGQLYIAMELVEGKSLRDWLKMQPRPSVRAIVDVFVQAGRGLAAAHRAGLVHRDFKPDNVMVGLDASAPGAPVNAVRVLDFGLASPVGEQLDTADVREESSGDLTSTRMTRTGAVMGTPAYMSPEQIEGKPADARSDQFSFCVALWEALYGERPFKGEDMLSLAYAVTSGEMRVPKRDPGVPSHVRRSLLKGLSIRPEDRYPDINALLRALSPRRRRNLVVAAVGTLALGGSLVALELATEDQQLCSGATDELGEVWGEERQRVVEDAFVATGAPFAGTTWTRVEAAMQDWSERWIAVHTQACEATRIRGERSEQVLDQEMRCLYAQRADARALIDVLTQADLGVLEGAVRAVGSLPAPERCFDLDRLQVQAPVPDDPEAAARVQAVRDELATIAWLELSGDAKQGLEQLQGLRVQADALGFEPLIAEVAFSQAELQQNLGEYEAAETSLEQTYNLALGLAHDDLARDVAGTLVYVVGVSLGRPDDAERWIDATQAMLRRTHPEPAEQGAIMLNIAGVRQEQGRFEDSESIAREALQLLVDAYGEADLRVGKAIDQLAMALALQGKLTEAQAEFERALANAQAQGETHPAVSRARANLGVALAKQGRVEDAVPHFEEAVRILETIYGEEHPDLGRLLSNLGGMHYELGRYEQAVAVHQRAIDLRVKMLGPDHPDLAGSYTNLGNVRAAQGREEDAIQMYDRAIALREKAYGPEHPSLTSTLGNKANSHRRLDRLDEAEAAQRRALAIAEKVHGPDAVPVAYPLTGLAEVVAVSGRPAEALPMFERALKIREGAPIDPGLIGATRFGLARALFDTGGDKQRAKQLAQQARQDYMASHRVKHEELEIIDRFLAELER